MPYFILPDKVAVLGDVHGNTTAVLRAVDIAKNHTNFIIQVGDYWLYNKSSVEKRLSENGMKMLFIPGNHEDWNFLNEVSDSEKLTRISDSIFYAPIGSRAVMGDKIVLFAGGAVSVDKSLRTPGYDWFPDETIKYKQAIDIVNDGNADIVFSHDCHSSSSVLNDHLDNSVKYFDNSVYKESDNHREMVEFIVRGVNSKCVIHGHYHYNYTSVDDGIKTYGMNMECDHGSVGIFDSSTYEMKFM